MCVTWCICFYSYTLIVIIALWLHTISLVLFTSTQTPSDPRSAPAGQPPQVSPAAGPWTRLQQHTSSSSLYEDCARLFIEHIHSQEDNRGKTSNWKFKLLCAKNIIDLYKKYVHMDGANIFFLCHQHNSVLYLHCERHIPHVTLPNSTLGLYRRPNITAFHDQVDLYR